MFEEGQTVVCIKIPDRGWIGLDNIKRPGPYVGEVFTIKSAVKAYRSLYLNFVNRFDNRAFNSDCFKPCKKTDISTLVSNKQTV